MGSDLTTRVTNEKAAYNDGGVYSRSARLQALFSHVFFCPNSVYASQFFDSSLAEIVPGAVVLEYGCFDGRSIPALAGLGPRTILGIDISERAIADARRNHAGLAEFCVMDGHRLAVTAESIDVVVGRAILHHLDFDRAIHEIYRVLKPGGRALFVEPLRDNPVGRLIRWLTPRARTRDELPLSKKQITRANLLFGANRHSYAGLMSVGCGMVSSLVSKNPANALMRVAHRIDLRLAQTPLRYWMRTAVLCWTK